MCRLRAAAAAMVWLVSLATAAPVSAQPVQRERERDEPGRRASFTAGASFGEGDTALALSAALAFRLSPRLELEFELAYARKLDFTLDACPPPLVCVLGGQFPVTGRTVSLVPQLVFDLRPAARRLGAYVQAGAGVGHVRQRYVLGPPFTTSVVAPVELTRSNVTAAFSFGGGVTMRLSRHLAVGADARSLHLVETDDVRERFITPSGALSTLRVGSRVSVRF